MTALLDLVIDASIIANLHTYFLIAKVLSWLLK
jgi:hypothetical protein